MRLFSERQIARAQEWVQSSDVGVRSIKYGFVGNIANNLYVRAVPLRKAGEDVSIFLHPQDTYVMSFPGWEEFDGEIPSDALDIQELHDLGIELPHVSQVYQYGQISDWHERSPEQFPAFVRRHDIERWRQYLCHLPTLEALQYMDALLSVQAPYLAYLANRPYMVTQAGGEIWFECSRDDALGRLQRYSFAQANSFLVSNPWSFAHARRYKMRHLLYVPFMIDEDQYSPGTSRFREEWERLNGGSFFVLSTSRLDWHDKGSNLALQGFGRFARNHPEVRLVVIDWGADRPQAVDMLRSLGLADRVLLVRPAGKRRLVEYLRAADVVLDQFVLGYYGATALEAMACGVPVIMRLERDQYDALCATGAPPVHHAASADQVHRALEQLISVHVRRTSGTAHRVWFLANHGSTHWMPVYRDLLRFTALGQHFQFENSPLSESLTADEIDYHRAQLLTAPIFPNYR